MKHDTEHFCMEQDEPLCRNKVPREGICLRIDNDPVNECFKLKTLRFLGKEAELMDKGENARHSDSNEPTASDSNTKTISMEEFKQIAEKQILGNK